MASTDDRNISALLAWLGLPSGLAMSATLGNAAAHYIAPLAWDRLSHLPAAIAPGTPETVVTGVSALCLPLAPLALMPAIRSLQRNRILARWGSAPLGLSMAGVGVGVFASTVRAHLLAGVALPVALQATGFFPVAAALAASVVGAIAAGPPPSQKKVALDPNGPWRASFWPMPEARKTLCGKDGIILGEAYIPAADPDRGGAAPLLRWMPKGQLLTIAGSGGGKGVSIVVPNCLGWGGPLIAHDPAGETLPIVRAHRESLGRKVRVLSLHADTDGLNALGWLNPDSPTFSMDVRTVVSWLEPGGPDSKEEGDGFAGMARSLCAALIMYVLCSDTVPPSEKHLLKVRQLGASSNLKSLLRIMCNMKDVAGGAMASAAGLISQTMESGETFAGVAMNFDTLTACLEGSSAVLCGQVSEERRFAFSDILKGDTDVFICMPSDVLRSQPQIARVILGGIASTFTKLPGRAPHDTLLLVDEMPLLGKMPILEEVLSFGRKYGLYFWAIIQDLGQLERLYGKGMRSWIGIPAVVQLFAVNDFETADMVSKRCGEFAAITESASLSTGNSSGRGGGSNSRNKSRNQQVTRAALLTPDEIMTLSVDEDGVPDEQILFVRGRKPLRCGLAKYHRRSEMLQIAGDNPFFKAGTPSKSQKRRATFALAYGIAMFALMAVAFISPKPLIAGDAVAVSASGLVPVYWPATGQQVGELQSGGKATIKFIRPDGFAEVRTMVDGRTYDVLIRKDALSR